MPASNSACASSSVRSGGHLAFEGASGSLLDAMRVRRLVWRGPSTQVTATNVALTWSPTALWSRGVVVQTLGAEHIELDLEASDTEMPLPASLALPFEITIESSRSRVSIGASARTAARSAAWPCAMPAGLPAAG